jgi:hypothetical protein
LSAIKFHCEVEPTTRCNIITAQGIRGSHCAEKADGGLLGYDADELVGRYQRTKPHGVKPQKTVTSCSVLRETDFGKHNSCAAKQ